MYYKLLNITNIFLSKDAFNLELTVNNFKLLLLLLQNITVLLLFCLKDKFFFFFFFTKIRN